MNLTAEPAEIARLRADLDAMRQRAEAAESVREEATDRTCHYRNLAITLGAPPNQMLDAYDRKLCADGIKDSEEALLNAPDVWALLATVEKERDVARWWARAWKAFAKEWNLRAFATMNRAVCAGTDTILRRYLPPEVYSRMWGPPLEQLGEAIDCAVQAARTERDEARSLADRYAAALDAIIARGRHVEGCRSVYGPCDCGVCPDHHDDNPTAAKMCPAPRHYAHGPDCTQSTRKMACVPECPTATAKKAREGT